MKSTFQSSSQCKLNTVSFKNKYQNSPLIFEVKLKQAVGYVCPTLSTEYKHGFSSHHYRKVAASGGAIPGLYHFLPRLGVSLDHSKQQCVHA
jgi:hypothetical protein